MWCNRCHLGSETHVPYKRPDGLYVCNQCGNSGLLDGKDSAFVHTNPVPVKAGASNHPGKSKKKSAPVVESPAE